MQPLQLYLTHIYKVLGAGTVDCALNNQYTAAIFWKHCSIFILRLFQVIRKLKANLNFLLKR